MLKLSKKILLGLPGMNRLLSLLKVDKKTPPGFRDSFTAQKALFDGSDCRVIFDVGAYVGKVTIIYRDLFPEATIYSFEPFPDSFRDLNRLADDTHIINPANRHMNFVTRHRRPCDA